jgi:hypothetical protein
MKTSTIYLLIVFSLTAASCGALTAASNSNLTSNGAEPATSKLAPPVVQNANSPETSSAAQTKPKNVREFFMALPEKYFTLEGCDKAKDKDCKKAKAEYLKTFTEVEDIQNGYFKGGCDGGQSCIEMAIFKRPDGTYLVGLMTSGEMMNDFFFLDHADGKWLDVSATAVPGFSKKNWYELPRMGTTVKVFAKKIVEKGDDFEISEKGEKLDDLVWKEGKFTKMKP